jgi:membrane-associated HD superfamily phosphohydrolase
MVLSMNDDAPETVLTNVVDVLEEHTKILQNYRQLFEQLFREIREIKPRLEKLESADSLDSSDTQFLKHVVVRLQAISKSIPDSFQEKV